MEDWLIDIRRNFHSHPELKFEEFNTSATIRRLLEELDIPYRYPVAKTGIVACIGSGHPVVALRADMDALPVQENTGLDFASLNPGIMHACGHDGHMTMLMGAAALLKAREPTLNGTVKLLFQPAEEGGAGGKLMVQEGALDDADAAFGFHVWPDLTAGTIASRPGSLMAGAILFEIEVQGRGGHAAMPHLTADPVVAGAAIVGALQTLVSRETSPFGSAVVSVTRFNAGDALNVIPDNVMLGGTVRATTDEDMQRVRRRMEALVSSQAEALGCSAKLEWVSTYIPPVINDRDMYDFSRDVALRLVGSDDLVQEAEPTMAGEDFSFMGRRVPSTFIFLGTRNETAGLTHGLHTPEFTVEEGMLKLGAALHTALATEFLARYQGMHS